MNCKRMRFVSVFSGADSRIHIDPDGTFTLDAQLVASSFGWTEKEFQNFMRRGLIKSVVERGDDEDIGKWRLSIISGNRCWQAIIDNDGHLAEQSMKTIPARKNFAV